MIYSGGGWNDTDDGGGGMIVCTNDLGRAESRPVDGSYCINGSVFSEAFFVGVDDGDQLSWILQH